MDNLRFNPRFVYRINVINNPYHFFDEVNNFLERDVLNQVLNLSMEEDESLKKDENVELDCIKKICKDKNNECPICLDKIKKGSCIFECKGCKEKYHYSCINKWIKMKSDCPKCRKQIPVRPIDSDGFEQWIDTQLKL